MNIAIVGYATEGTISYQYFVSQGHQVTICDQNPHVAVPSGAQTRLGDDYLENLHQFDLVVRSAGIPPQQIIARNPGIEPKITTAVNEFLAACPTPNTIGVTGTKGKGTTSTLVAKMLQATGKNVFLGGNIGNSPLEFIHQVSQQDWVVLELSSFQLSDLRHAPHIATCLMVVPEHLNWHVTMADYVRAKSNLFRHQQSRDTAIYYALNDTSKSIAGTSPGLKVPYFTRPGAYVSEGAIWIEEHEICKLSDIKLLGEHNWQNVCAAVTTVWQAVQDVPAMRSVITSFSGLEHRIEFVRELEGIRYYDDSFGTTPETTMVAIRAFQQPKVVILGGSTKGSTYDELAASIASGTVRHVILIGNTTNPNHACASADIEQALRAHKFNAITSLVGPGGSSMADIVHAAQAVAHPGDVILLSTGCASFDMFTDYKDRATQFRQAVLALA